MTELAPSLAVAVGTAATLLATLLVLLRVRSGIRPGLLSLARRWIAVDGTMAGLVLALLTAVAASAFAVVPAQHRLTSGAAPRAPAENSAGGPHASADGDRDVAALQAYLEGAGSPPQAAGDPGLPDVETMIAGLEARLEQQPGDAKGWKMLGWAYLNTGRPDEAAKAYEMALGLEPGDADAGKALEAARSASRAGLPDPSTKPSADQADGTIRGMVDRLHARLEHAPNDESGWVNLMRSRMVLGEREAAKSALAKALAAFAGDAAAASRLTAAARELGIEAD